MYRVRPPLYFGKFRWCPTCGFCLVFYSFCTTCPKFIFLPTWGQHRWLLITLKIWTYWIPVFYLHIKWTQHPSPIYSYSSKIYSSIAAMSTIRQHLSPCCSVCASSVQWIYYSFFSEDWTKTVKFRAVNQNNKLKDGKALYRAELILFIFFIIFIICVKMFVSAALIITYLSFGSFFLSWN